VSSGAGIPGALPYPKCRSGSSYVDCDTIANFDPAANQPLVVGYCVGNATIESGCSGAGTMPARVSVQLTTTSEATLNCALGRCAVAGEYQAAGAHEVTFWGMGTLQYLADAKYVMVVRDPNGVAKNEVLAFGTAPVIANVAISPLMLHPQSTTSSAPQQITFDVSSFGGRTVALKVELRNVTSMSPLRTIVLPAAAAGSRTIAWDGRADNGAWVAPGTYEIRITATDSIGSTTVIRPITTVRY
jgi:hypothetical protein